MQRDDGPDLDRGLDAHGVCHAPCAGPCAVAEGGCPGYRPLVKELRAWSWNMTSDEERNLHEHNARLARLASRLG